MVKVKSEFACPLCGQALPAAFFNPSIASPGGGPWGEALVRRRALSPIAMIPIGLLLLATFIYSVFATWEDSRTEWLLTLLAMIVVIPVAIWLRRKAIAEAETPMRRVGFQISFLPRALVKLADNERVSVWESRAFHGRHGTLTIGEKSVSLSGHWRLSFIANLLGEGPESEWFIKPLFLQKRAWVVPIEALRDVIVHTKRDRRTYHLFQQRNNNLVEVHVFTLAPQKTPSLGGPSLDNVLRAFVPPRLWREEPAG